MKQIKNTGKPDKRYVAKTMNTIIEVHPVLPTKYGFVEMVLLPVRVVDGCVTNYFKEGE